jgi:AraC-like DNA-binding protein
VIPSAWAGVLSVGQGWALWRGAVGDNVLHRHLAAQAVFAVSPVAVMTAEGLVRRSETLLIDPLTPHRLLSHPDATILFLEPGARLPETLAEDLNRRAALAIRLEANDARHRYWTHAPAAAVAAAHPAWGPAALQVIDSTLAAGRVRLADAAAVSGLSPERFRRVFGQTYGMPFKRFVLWRRVQAATALLMEGRDATHAAHAAGFADSAHFSRTMKAMLGVQPSRFRRAS